MASVFFTTFHDLMCHALDYAGSSSASDVARDARRSALNGYQTFSNSARWTYYQQRGRLTTAPYYATGTIAYVHTGGATCERQVTLTGGTWPLWAAFGVLVINNTPYSITSYKSTTVVQLSATSNPGADVAAGTAYTIYRDTYPLPSDFLAMDELINVGRVNALRYSKPNVWLSLQRIYHGPAVPYTYCITSDPHYFGSMALRLFPAPDQAYTLDFMYQRKPRSILIDEYTTGTATVNNGAVAVTGIGTVWSSKHIGSVLRLSADTINLPDGRSGAHPFDVERTILDVTGPTALTIDAAVTSAYAAVKYRISDPVDIEEGAMSVGLEREVEKQMRIARRITAMPEEQEAYRMAMLAAREADSRSFATRVAGAHSFGGLRLRDMPAGPDVS